MSKLSRLVPCAAALALVTLTALAGPVAADHTDPRTELAPTEGTTDEGLERGEGTWEHLRNFRGGASPALTGGGTDTEFFTPKGTGDIYGSFGTLGQDTAGSIGQRIIRLTENGVVEPTWVADHGSAHCEPNSGSVTALQHDTQVAQRGRVSLLTDTTDQTGRCHDTAGGGIEIVDMTRVHRPAAKPREVHLVRFAGFSHTNTVDGQRPWIVYNSSADFSGRNWIDVMDMSSCFGRASWTRAERIDACRPVVSRIQLDPKWTQQRDQDTGKLEEGSATCHDITYSRQRLYCAALNSTLILDVSDLVRRDGSVRGAPLSCTLADGTVTKAKVTDCSATDDAKQRATGWRFLGKINHPGRDCGAPEDARNCNTNLQERSDEGVAVSHEADPTRDRRFMFVTDERGGGIVPPGASCAPGIENPYGNGGAHAFDISDPSRIRYARTPSGEKSIFISDAIVPDPTFCDIHVLARVRGEQRFIVGYYSQGIKIVDYFIDGQGRLQFHERASFTLPGANTWAAQHFLIKKNEDGSRTYYIAANDIHRGIDVVSWTGPPNPEGSKPPEQTGDKVSNSGLLGASVLVLAGAALYRRRHRVEE